MKTLFGPNFVSLSTSILVAGLIAIACGKKNENATVDISETGQQIGDVMASVDEAGGSTGALSMLESTKKLYARLSPGDIRDSWRSSVALNEAQAVTCAGASTFGTCTNNVITRNFAGCTIGAATFTGTVTLTFTDDAPNNICLMTTNTHSVTRAPNFTVTGRRGATLTVSKTGTNGQVITKGTGTNFSFTNDGIRRVFTASGSTIFDFTTQTNSAIAISGTSRASRTMTGGQLRVTNNLTNVTCDYVPTSVTWTSACNCPTSGSWAGSCSDGKSTNLTITGCGSGTFAVGNETENFTFDRCYGI